MKYLVALVLLLSSGVLRAQLEIAPDTVLYSARTGGAIDTFDVWRNNLPSTFDGGRQLSGSGAFSVDQLFTDMTSYRLNPQLNTGTLRYSSLPYLGFAYSFGSQGTQMLHLRYTQAFSPKLLLNLDYDRTTGSGFLRSSSFSGDFVRLQLQRMGQRYSFRLGGRFQSYETSHPDGITTDTLLNTFGLEFTPVLRSASSTMKMAGVNLQNFLNFTSDSLNHFGLVSKHNYTILHREYYESALDTLPGYTMFNDSVSQTQDLWNQPSISNGAGIYFLNRTTNFYLDATIQHRYWNSWDRRDLRDTNEVDLMSELSFKWKGVQLKNHLRFNIAGGFNGWEEKAQVSYGSQKLKVAGSLLLSSLPADPLQRFYYGNNYDYELNTINRQVWLKVGGKAEYAVNDSILSFGVQAAHFSIPSSYVFNGSSWELSDSLGSASSIGFYGHLGWKFLHWRPKVVLSTDRNGYLPTFQAYSRLYVKGRLFEAKRLQVVAGVDVAYYNAHSVRSYIPSMDAFYWNAIGGTNPGLLNLHAFVSMGIEQFRFYARFENIGYFWNDKTILEAQGYPIAGTRVRVGITWEFFN